MQLLRLLTALMLLFGLIDIINVSTQYTHIYIFFNFLFEIYIILYTNIKYIINNLYIYKNCCIHIVLHYFMFILYIPYIRHITYMCKCMI